MNKTKPLQYKGPVDARIASMKQNMLVNLNSGHDVATPCEMKSAIENEDNNKGFLNFKKKVTKRK